MVGEGASSSSASASSPSSAAASSCLFRLWTRDGRRAVSVLVAAWEPGRGSCRCREPGAVPWTLHSSLRLGHVPEARNTDSSPPPGRDGGGTAMRQHPPTRHSTPRVVRGPVAGGPARRSTLARQREGRVHALCLPLTALGRCLAAHHFGHGFPEIYTRVGQKVSFYAQHGPRPHTRFARARVYVCCDSVCDSVIVCVIECV